MAEMDEMRVGCGDATLDPVGPMVPETVPLGPAVVQRMLMQPLNSLRPVKIVTKGQKKYEHREE